MPFVITPDLGTFVTFNNTLPKSTNGTYETIEDARVVANYVLGVTPNIPRTISEVVEIVSAQVVITTSTPAAAAAETPAADSGTAS